MSGMGHNIEGVAIDLDGTLVNSAPDLAAAANRLLRKLSRPNLTQEHVQALIGDGIDALFDRVLASGSGTYRSLDERTVLRGEFKRSYRERIFARGDLYAGVTYAFSERWVGEAGYRFLAIDYQAKRVDLDVDIHGPVIGLTMRF